MTVVWTAEALADLVSLRAYISQRNPAAAKRIALEIIQSVEDLLPDHPHMGRAGRVPGTRELVIPQTPYVVPYRVRNGRIQYFASITPRGVGRKDSSEDVRCVLQSLEQAANATRPASLPWRTRRAPG